jgi:hypothetical protein
MHGEASYLLESLQGKTCPSMTQVSRLRSIIPFSKRAATPRPTNPGGSLPAEELVTAGTVLHGTRRPLCAAAPTRGPTVWRGDARRVPPARHPGLRGDGVCAPRSSDPLRIPATARSGC